MINIVMASVLLALVTNAQILPVTDLLPDCAGGSSTFTCTAGGNVVQTGSANPVVSSLVGRGWSFTATQLANSVDWRFYSSTVTAGLAPSPISSQFCTAGAGLNFQKLGTQNAAGTGTIWVVLYLNQPSTPSSPSIVLSSGNGCTYSYSISTAVQGGPVYFYTNIDDGSYPEIKFRSQLDPPSKSAVCTTPAQDSLLGVSTIDLVSVAPATSSFVLIYAGFVAGPSNAQINCFGSFRFVFPRILVPPMKKMPGMFSKGKGDVGLFPIPIPTKGKQDPGSKKEIEKGKKGPKMTSFTPEVTLRDSKTGISFSSRGLRMEEQL